MAASDPRTARWLPWAAGAVIVAAAALAHGGALGNGFVTFDDASYIYENPRVTAGLTAESVAWAFRIGGRGSYFHPLTWLSLMADAELFGMWPLGFHAVNLVLHALNGVLVFLAFWSATRRPWPSAGAALLWAVHPLTVEAVAWAAERKAVLSTAFALGAVLVHSWHARRPSPWKVGASTGLLLLGLLAKPAIVVVPALLLAVDVWPLRRLSLAPRGVAAAGGGTGFESGVARRLVAEKLPAALVAAAVLAVAVASVRGNIDVAAARIPLGDRLAIGIGAIPRYVSAAFWPARLAVHHPYPPQVAWSAFASGSALILAATAAAVALARRWPAGVACWAWFLLSLAPYLGLLQSGLWPEWAERFAYLPLVGIAALVAFGLADLGARFARGGVLAGFAITAAVVALVPVTRAQVATWRDSLSLYAHAAGVEPRSAMMRSNLGNAFLAAGRAAQAEAALRAALAMDPGLPLANAELATILMHDGRAVEAERHFLAALRAWPDMPEALFNYAELLRVSLHDPARARPYYARFVEVAPPRLDRQRAAVLRYLSR